jgi:hypothetical protein
VAFAAACLLALERTYELYQQTGARCRRSRAIYLLPGQHRLVAGDIRAAINKVLTIKTPRWAPSPVLDGYPA